MTTADLQSQTAMNSSSIVIVSSAVHVDDDLRKSPEADGGKSEGKCTGCGQQLYVMKQKTKLLFSLSRKSSSEYRKIPISVPNLVEKGQCLTCATDRTVSVSSQQSSKYSLCSLSSIPQPPPPLLGGSILVKNNTETHTDNNKHDDEDDCGDDSCCVGNGDLNAIYKGEHKKGLRHGEGELKWTNGDVYKGSFRNNMMEGKGTLVFGGERGGEYAGDWYRNQMHGEGTRRYPNGDVFVGTYKKGSREGEGRFYFATGDLYWGEFRKNLMHGPGRYYFACGQSFAGTFVNGKRMGKGKIQRNDGSIEIYQYVNNSRVGQGVRWSKDRTKAWRLWKKAGVSPKTSSKNAGSGTEEKRIPVSEAVILVQEIEKASMEILAAYDVLPNRDV